MPDVDAAISLKDTRERVRDLFAVRPAVYWSDFLASTAVGWTAFALAVARADASGPRIALSAVAALALYRAVLFVHEIAHFGKGAVPGFAWAWDLLIGIPLQLPSFMYLEVHVDHHRRTVYGTPRDPEYLPFAAGPRRRIVRFLLEPLVVPALFLARYALLAPLSLLLGPRFRRFVVESASSLAINFGYRRAAPSPQLRTRWIVCETAACLFAWAVLGLIFVGRASPQVLVEWYAVSASVAFVNQVRTLGAHRYRNTGGEMDVVGQLVDSVNTPGGIWTEFWAPVGLRYHALHHYLPDMPYHALGKAHRRLAAALPAGGPYSRTISPSLVTSLATVWREAASPPRGAVAPAAVDAGRA